MKRVVLLAVFLIILLVSFAACDFMGTPPADTSKTESSTTGSVLSDTAGPEIEQTEPVNSEPAETGPVETLPVETKPVETEPVETKPVETEPVETEPVETEPVATEPVETEPIETEPVATEPVETQPVETEPVETQPVETEPVDTETIHTHTWGPWKSVMKPTCTEAGLIQRTCACGEKEQEPVAALGHTPGSKATCTTAQVCTLCEAQLAPATGHSFGSWYDTKAPTETESGEKRRDCENCDAYETAPIAPQAHDHSNWPATILPGTAPTCTTPGKTEGKKCSGCGEILVAQDTIPATGHRYESVVTPPTCTEQGYTTHTCHCGDTRVDTYVKALGHSFGSWYDTKAPTETESGEKRRDCANCDAYETAPIAPQAHDHSNWPATILPGVAPTCTTPGKTEGKKCSGCGDVLVAQNEIPATGHDMGAWKQTKAPTCTSDGAEKSECAACDHVETRIIVATGHNVVVDPAVEATCTTKGMTEGKHCSICSAVLVAQKPLDPVSHDFAMHNGTVCRTEACKLFHSCRYCDFSLLIPLEDRYFFKQLTKAQQENITAIYQALVAGESDYITLPNPMTDPEADSSVIASFLYNCCPELVQLSTNEMRRWWRGNNEIKFQLVLSKSEFEGYSAALFDFLLELNQTTADMSDWEKSKFVYDLIIDRTTYEAQSSDAVNKHEGSSLGPLAAGRARCQGYANAYQLCMWATGVECYMITGVAGPENGPHAWNIVKLNGQYYLSDVTWDDGDGTPTAYAYFNVSTVEFAQHTAEDFWYDWNMPACNSMDMSLFVMYDSYVEEREDLKTEYMRIFDANYGKNHKIYLKFENAEDFETVMDSSFMQQCMQEFVNKHHISSLSWSITYWSEVRVLCFDLEY